VCCSDVASRLAWTVFLTRRYGLEKGVQLVAVIAEGGFGLSTLC
jgi:hypothetical protein